MRYIRPKSLTWWAGVFLIVMGILQAAGLPEAWVEGQTGVTGVLQALTGALAAILGGAGGDVAPAALIGLGGGLVGLRDALIRDRAAQQEELDDALDYLGSAMARADFGTVPSATYPTPLDEDDLPPGVIDPYGPGGSRE